MPPSELTELEVQAAPRDNANVTKRSPANVTAAAFRGRGLYRAQASATQCWGLIQAFQKQSKGAIRPSGYAVCPLSKNV